MSTEIESSEQQEDKMKSGRQDQAEGGFHKVKGDVKERVGRATGDSQTEGEGTVEKERGKVQEKVGQVKRVFNK